MTSTNPYTEGREHFLFAYNAPMVFQIHFCLTIKAGEPSVFRWAKNKFRPFLEVAQPMVHPQEMGETRYNKAKKPSDKGFRPAFLLLCLWLCRLWLRFQQVGISLRVCQQFEGLIHLLIANKRVPDAAFLEVVCGKNAVDD